MKKRQILWAIVFGSMLAITGCGSDETTSTGSGGTGGSGGTRGMNGTGGGSGGGDASTVCNTICGNCGQGTTECQSSCEDGFSDGGDVDFESCPTELNTLTSCVDGANSCLSFIIDCGTEYTNWITCVAGVAF